MEKIQFRNRGSALPLALIAIVLLLIMGSTLLSMSLNSRIYSFRTASDITARCAADAGLTKALYEMNLKLQDKSWDGSTPSPALNVCLSDCDATFSYIVTGDLASGYVITSVGKSGDATRLIRATIGLKGIFDHAILTRDSLILKSDTVIDGYNSMDPSDSDIKVYIGSQSTSEASVVLNNNVVVEGDVLVGIGGDPETGIKDLGATISGNKRAATIQDSLKEISPPVLTKMSKSITGKGTTISLTSADNGVYTEIDLQKGKSDTILEVSEGDVVLHITGDIELDQGCEIVVKDGASLTIYVDGNIVCREGSGINTEAPPEEASTLKLFATGEGKQTLDVKANSEWTGVIYAPNDDVLLYANGDAYGSIVADTFEFKNGGDFHYDEALREATTEDEGVTFAVARWSEEKVTTAVEHTSDLIYQLSEQDLIAR
ncbi:MAG: hypothetical protein JW715_01705 [Sedimentisphaerales bacterium]|nr:hypothetical protein [Sedimentisphaerales bacterium]